MQTEISIFNSAAIAIEEYKGEEGEKDPTTWTYIDVTDSDGDLVRLTCFGCPPIEMGKDGQDSRDVGAELVALRTEVMERNLDLLKARQDLNDLRRDIANTLTLADRRKERAVKAEQVCTELRDDVEHQESLVQQQSANNADLCQQVNGLEDENHRLGGQLADAQGELRTMRGALDDAEAAYDASRGAA